MSSETGKRLGDFEIGREIGRGGMGVVYEGRQVSLNRPVAIKVLPPGTGMTAAARERFHREAQAAGKLQHSHIVAVFAEGEEDDTCYFAMELVEGETLDRFVATAPTIASTAVGRSTTANTGAASDSDTIAGRSSFAASSAASSARSDDFDQIAGWVADVADALEYAHQQGIVHRDVKPSNVMLGTDGRVRLMDFGLARIAQEPGMTMSGEMLGTPRYMSPEQIAAGRIPLDHRTDVYSLGATLYELLTMRPPFTASGRDQIIAQIIHQDPPRPRQVDSQIPLDLETICLKSLEKDPNERYQSAGEMAADLRRYLERYAISAKQIGPVGRAIKLVRRRPGAAAMASCIVIAILAAGILAYRTRRLAEQRLEQLRETATVETMRGDFLEAEAAIAEAEKMGAAGQWMHLMRGQAALRQGDVNTAVGFFERALRQTPESGAAFAMTHYGYLVSGNPAKYFQGITDLGDYELTQFEDYVLAGQAVARADPAWGLRLLDKANSERKSAFGYQTSAEIRLDQAWRTADAELAERAVREATIAEEMLETPLEASCIRLLAHMTAAKVYLNEDRAEEAERHLQQADQIDAELPPGDLRSLPTHFMAPGFYFELRDRDQEALEFFQPIAESDNITAIRHSIIARYRLKEWDAAQEAYLHMADWVSGDETEVIGAFLAAEREGAASARAIYNTLESRALSAGSLTYYPSVRYAEILRLLGEPKAAQDFLLSTRSKLEAQPLDPEWYAAELRYLCGEMDAEDLLQAAGRSLDKRMIANYDIGLSALAEGERDLAKRHFGLARDAGLPPHHEWYWASAFLAQLENEPTWPSWITVKD